MYHNFHVSVEVNCVIVVSFAVIFTLMQTIWLNYVLLDSDYCSYVDVVYIMLWHSRTVRAALFVDKDFEPRQQESSDDEETIEKDEIEHKNVRFVALMDILFSLEQDAIYIIR